jgi:hypothetical protein
MIYHITTEVISTNRITATEFVQGKLKNVRQVGGIAINIICTSKIEAS